MTLLQNLPDWIYMLIGTIVFVVPAFIYLVAKGSAGKPEGLDDGIKFASMEAGYISMPGDM